MKIKVYFDVFSWTNQNNIFFWSTIPVTPIQDGSKRYVAEIEIPDNDADFEKASVELVKEILCLK